MEIRPFARLLFLTLVIVSAVQVSLTVYLQRRDPLEETCAAIGPLGRTFLSKAIGSVLSEVQAVYGVVLTLVSGSIFYVVGFSLLAWASLFWVRGRFKQNLEKLPDLRGTSSSDAASELSR